MCVYSVKTNKLVDVRLIAVRFLSRGEGGGGSSPSLQRLCNEGPLVLKFELRKPQILIL